MDNVSMMKEILTNAKLVLDLWCGSWSYSILAASYDCDVVAVDNESMKKFSASPYLNDHPRIKFLSCSIENIENYINHQYNYIIIKNVIMFLDKNFVIDVLIPWLINSLSTWWYIYLTYFDSEDFIQNNSKNIKSIYSISDFEHIYSMQLEYHSHQILVQNENQHSIHHIFLKKEA